MVEELLIYLRVSIDIGYLSPVTLDGKPASTRASIPSVITYSKILPRLRSVDMGNIDDSTDPGKGIRDLDEAALNSNVSRGGSVGGITSSHIITKSRPNNHGENTSANAMHHKLVEMVSNNINPRLGSLFIDPTSR